MIYFVTRGVHQKAYDAALAKRDTFERMKEMLAEMHKEKRSCEEAISDLKTKQRQQAVKVHACTNCTKQLRMCGLCTRTCIAPHPRTRCYAAKLTARLLPRTSASPRGAYIKSDSKQSHRRRTKHRSTTTARPRLAPGPTMDRDTPQHEVSDDESDGIRKPPVPQFRLVEPGAADRVPACADEFDVFERVDDAGQFPGALGERVGADGQTTVLVPADKAHVMFVLGLGEYAEPPIPNYKVTERDWYLFQKYMELAHLCAPNSKHLHARERTGDAK